MARLVKFVKLVKSVGLVHCVIRGEQTAEVCYRPFADMGDNRT
jgi:hypothetical protein